MNIKEVFIERYSEPGSNSITLEAIMPDMIIGVIILLLVDSFYMIVSGKVFVMMMMIDTSVLEFLHCILTFLTAVITIMFIIMEGPEILSDIWYEVKDWEIFTFKEK